MSSAASTEWVKTLGQATQSQILPLPASPDSRGGVITIYFSNKICASKYLHLYLQANTCI